MTFETHILKGTLSKYIESIFHFKNFIPDHSIERVVPTGHIFIIFELDGFVRNTFDNDTLKSNHAFTRVWVSGVHKNYISISAHQKSEMFVIQFKPFGAYPFFHFPIQKLNDKILSAKEIFGNEIIELRKEILTKKSSKEKFDCADQLLQKSGSHALAFLQKCLQTEIQSERICAICRNSFDRLPSANQKQRRFFLHCNHCAQIYKTYERNIQKI